MTREKLTILLVICLVLLFCAWTGEWDRPIIVWASEACIHR